MSPCYHLLAPISTYVVVQGLAQLLHKHEVVGSNTSIGTIHSFPFHFPTHFPVFLVVCLSYAHTHTHTCTYTHATTTTINTNWYMHMHMHTLPLTPIQPPHSACKFIACMHSHIQTQTQMCMCTCTTITTATTINTNTTTTTTTITITQCKLKCVPELFVESMQPNAAYTRAISCVRPCPCVSCIWLLDPTPTCAQDGLDPLQLSLVVFFICQLAHLHTLHKKLFNQI